MIGQTISHHKILEKLGEGGMGVVYKAEDTKLKRIVALKFLPPELTRDKDAKTRFIHEAQAASALQHNNICTIHEIDEIDDGRTFICMDYYKGETLKEKIAKGPLPIEDTLDIVTQVAEGLSKAHESGMVHRDIKPANIMITSDRAVKIVDFGLAKLAGQTQVTKTGTTVGTVAYMSPEQAQGQEVDHRTDIWSLGAMLYEMLAGRLPFRGEVEQAVLYSILNEDPEPVTSTRADVPVAIEGIIEKTLSKDPAKRYETTDELLAELEMQRDQITLGIKERRFRALRKLRRRKRLTVAVAAVVVMAAAAVLVQVFHTRSMAIDSVAVLPFANLSGDEEQEYFSDGITEALITELSKIGALRVISRTSAMHYKQMDKPLPKIARELDVDAVVEGSVLRDGERVRITAQLIGAVPERHLWAENYDRDFGDILILSSEVARAIADEIKVKLTPTEETRLATTRPVNPETYEAYLKGMFYLNKFTPDGIEKGLAYLHQAVEKDPADPLAYAGQALGYCIIAHTPSPPPDAIPRARTATLRALELDETLAEAHLALAMINIFSDWDRMGAVRAVQRALELNPSLAPAYAQYGWYLLIDGHVDEALAELYRAQELDPLAPIYPAWQGWMYFWEGYYDEAIEEALKSLELYPDFPVGLYVLGCGYAAKGMYEEAIAAHQKAGAISPDWRWGLGHTYALAGRIDEALEVAAELESGPKVWDTWGIAEIYAALGDKDEAFAWLEAAYQQRHPYIQWLRRDGNFKPLRDDPRFKDLLRRMNFPVNETQK